MNYKEIYKHQMFKYISEDEYNKCGPRVHFYKFMNFILAFGVFKETNKKEVKIIKLNKYNLNYHNICNYILIFIREKHSEKDGKYKSDVNIRFDDIFELREMFELFKDIVVKMNSLNIFDRMHIHIDEDSNLILSYRERILTRAEEHVIFLY